MGFTTRPELAGTFGAVSSTHWIATAVGMGILERGGNAFDAGCATAFTLQVVEPHLNGPGGDVPVILYDVKKGKAWIPNRIYGGKVVENICQALARIAIGEQMLQVAKHYKVVMTVHDAIACIVPEHDVEAGLEYVEMCMRMRPKWAMELPLNCEAGSADSYGGC